MKKPLAVSYVSVCILLTLASFGCGSGKSAIMPITQPPTTGGPVTATANPLVAQYTITQFQQGLAAWVEFGTDTNYGRQTSIVTTSATSSSGPPLTILVAGMLPQTTYHMRAHLNWVGGSSIDPDSTFTTGALPASFQLPVITVNQPNPNVLPATGVEILSLIEPANTNMLQSVVTDLQGNIIWYYAYDAGGATPVKPMPNGDMVLQLTTDLREVDLAGNTIRDISIAQINQSLQANSYPYTANKFSHDVLTLPNGHWITICQATRYFTDLPGYPGSTAVEGDLIVDIDPNTNVAWLWSSFDYLDPNRHPEGLPDWTHSNALVLTADGNLLLSMRNQSWILKINYANGAGNGNVLWTMGEDGDVTLLGGDPSQWFYGQHYPNVLSTNGTQSIMAVFDDGNLRIDSSGAACGATPSSPACYTRATIYQIDESTNTAVLLWQDLPGFFSWWGGSIDVLSNGDVEFDSSEPFNTTSSQINEVTQSDNPLTVWQMTITGENAYRGYRIPSLYPGVAWQQ